MIAYKHQRNDWNKKEPNITFAVTVPSKEQLENVLTTFHVDNLSVLLGVSFCNPKDKFKKKTGRELAQALMEFHKLQLIMVEKNLDQIMYTFKFQVERYLQSKETSDGIIQFATNKHSNFVKMETCGLYA